MEHDHEHRAVHDLEKGGGSQLKITYYSRISLRNLRKPTKILNEDSRQTDRDSRLVSLEYKAPHGYRYTDFISKK
jgi:hypothetical protein